jgi:oligosaccharide reducing-end xylanase
MTVISRQLDFFYSQDVRTCGNGYTLDGKQVTPWHSAAVVAPNAVAAPVTDNPHAPDFIRDFWNMAQPTGQYRYFDGCLYVLGLQQCSGSYRMIGFTGE